MRCCGKCKTKARVKFLRDYELLKDLEANADIITNPDNWIIVELKTPQHTCGDPEEPFYSDQVNFGILIFIYSILLNKLICFDAVLKHPKHPSISTEGRNLNDISAGT